MSRWEPHSATEYRCTGCELVFLRKEPSCTCEPGSLETPPEVEPESIPVHPCATLDGRVDRLCELSETVRNSGSLGRDERASVDAERQLLALIHEMQKGDAMEKRVRGLEAALLEIQSKRKDGADLRPPQDSTAELRH